MVPKYRGLVHSNLGEVTEGADSKGRLARGQELGGDDQQERHKACPVVVPNYT